MGGEERDFDIPDPADPDIVFASGLGGKITRWDAHTGQVADVAPFLEPNYGRRQTETTHHFVWVTPMAISKVGEPVLYLGGDVVFASRDRGASLEDHQPRPDGQGSRRPALRRRPGDRRRPRLRLWRHLVDGPVSPHGGRALGRDRQRPRPAHPRRRRSLGQCHSIRPAGLGQDRQHRSLAAGGRDRLHRHRQPAPGRPGAARLRDPRLRQDLARHLRRLAGGPFRQRGEGRYAAARPALRRDRRRRVRLVGRRRPLAADPGQPADRLGARPGGQGRRPDRRHPGPLDLDPRRPRPASAGGRDQGPRRRRTCTPPPRPSACGRT